MACSPFRTAAAARWPGANSTLVCPLRAPASFGGKGEALQIRFFSYASPFPTRFPPALPLQRGTCWSTSCRHENNVLHTALRQTRRPYARRRRPPPAPARGLWPEGGSENPYLYPKRLTMQKADESNLWHYNPQLRAYATHNRRNMTKAEACLWKYVLGGRGLMGTSSAGSDLWVLTSLTSYAKNCC